MLAIASLLDRTTNLQTRNLWRFLEEKCGLAGIKSTPYPHFSWLSCDDLDWAQVSKKLESIVSDVHPFTVSTSGIGIFPGRIPILYIPLVKTPQLMGIHQRIWGEVDPFLVRPQVFYVPEKWMPHITIAYGDLNPDNLVCAIRDLAFESIAIDILIDNISVIFRTDENVGVKGKFTLE